MIFILYNNIVCTIIFFKLLFHLFHLATIGDCCDVIAKFLLLALLLLDVVFDDDITVFVACGSFRCCNEDVIEGSFFMIFF